jgi:hypothetical protein
MAAMFGSYASFGRMLACCGSAVALGCGPSGGFGDADGAPPDAIVYDIDASAAPETLSQSGLYANTAAGQLAPGVRPYRPRFELWSDGTEKRRWVSLPSDAQIDNTDGDFWTFPEGTRLWKEFSQDGVKLETRLLYKRGPTPGDWYMMSYVWNDDESDALAAPAGDPSARGTGHRVPSQAECDTCHAPMHDTALGFSAIQLDQDPATAGQLVTLDQLLVEGRLLFGTGEVGYPHYPLPGTDNEQEILGYLHGNCSGCHNERSPVLAGVPTRPIFLQRVDERFRDAIESAPAYSSTVGVRAVNTEQARSLIEPGDPNESAIYVRMTSRDPNLQMPPIGTRLVDESATLRIRAWIESMPPADHEPGPEGR